MNKELTPLEAFEEILFVAKEYSSDNVVGYLEKFYYDKLDIVKNALEDYEKKTKLAKEYADVNNVAKRLKALEIIKKLPKEEKQILLNAIYTYLKNEKEYDLVEEILL